MWLLGVAGGFRVVSVFIDLVVRTRALVEDGAKLFGAATWALVLVGTSFQAVRRAVEREARPPR